VPAVNDFTVRATRYGSEILLNASVIAEVRGAGITTDQLRVIDKLATPKDYMIDRLNQSLREASWTSGRMGR
jgi:hypothetical protein